MRKICKVKLYKEGTDCQRGQFGKRLSEIGWKITFYVFHISLLTPFFTSVLYLSPFLPTSATCSITPTPNHHTHYSNSHVWTTQYGHTAPTHCTVPLVLSQATALHRHKYVCSLSSQWKSREEGAEIANTNSVTFTLDPTKAVHSSTYTSLR